MIFGLEMSQRELKLNWILKKQDEKVVNWSHMAHNSDYWQFMRTRY
jgi:hypothetical protein